MADLALVTAEQAERIAERAADLAVRRVLAERAVADELLAVPEVARRLGVSVRAVRAYIAAGALACVRLPSTAPSPRKRSLVRVRSSELARFVAAAEQREEPDAVIDLSVARAMRRAGGGAR